AAAIDHDVVKDPAEPGAHTVDATDVHLAGDAANIAADAKMPLGGGSIRLDTEDALARLQVVSSVATPDENALRYGDRRQRGPIGGVVLIPISSLVSIAREGTHIGSREGRDRLLSDGCIADDPG